MNRILRDVIIVVVVAIALVVLGVQQLSERKKLYTCIANQRDLEIAMLMWQMDHSDADLKGFNGEETYNTLKDYIDREIFYCPDGEENSYGYRIGSVGEVECLVRGIFHQPLR